MREVIARFITRAALTLFFLLLGGCSPAAKDPGVPASANLVLELVGPSGARSTVPAKLQAEKGGALYVVNASKRTNLYSGTVQPNDVILLYESGVSVGTPLKTRGLGPSIYEQRVASFDPNVTYRVYFQPGGTVDQPTPVKEGSPTTRVFEVRQRKVDPTNANPE